MNRGAPLGNSNARRGRVWRDAIDRALKRRSRADQIKEIDKLADRLIDLCFAGDVGALREFGDRVEGKAVQAVEITQTPDVVHMTDEELLAIAADYRARRGGGSSAGETQGPEEPAPVH